MPRLNLNESSYQNDKGRSKDKTGATPEGAVRGKSKSDSKWEERKKAGYGHPRLLSSQMQGQQELKRPLSPK